MPAKSKRSPDARICIPRRASDCDSVPSGPPPGLVFARPFTSPAKLNCLFKRKIPAIPYVTTSFCENSWVGAVRIATPRLPKVLKRPLRPNFLPTNIDPYAFVWFKPMPVAWFELGRPTPTRNPSDGPRLVSFRNLNLVQRMKSPGPFVELAPGANDNGIADGQRVLILRKF